MNITEFLEARIAEDETEAGAASVSMHGKIHEDRGDWSMYVLGAERDSTNAQDDFIVKWWPYRVLAECAAKRKIIEQWVDPDSISLTMGDVDAGHTMGIDSAVRALAAVYADHPDYQQEWAG